VVLIAHGHLVEFEGGETHIVGIAGHLAITAKHEGFVRKHGKDLLLTSHASEDCLEVWGKIPQLSGLIIPSTRGGVVLRYPRLAKTAMQSYGQNERDIRYGEKINCGAFLEITIGTNP
jgi:hypothetical protein